MAAAGVVSQQVRAARAKSVFELYRASVKVDAAPGQATDDKTLRASYKDLEPDGQKVWTEAATISRRDAALVREQTNIHAGAVVTAPAGGKRARGAAAPCTGKRAKKVAEAAALLVARIAHLDDATAWRMTAADFAREEGRVHLDGIEAPGIAVICAGLERLSRRMLKLAV
jgi:hypothetical protein